MDYKHLIAGALAFSLAACSAGCSDKDSSSGSNSETTTSTSADITTDTAASTETATGTTEASTEERQAPVPAEAPVPEAVTFDDGDFSFASPILTDDDSAQGTLSVVEVQGNKMLKFTDDNTVPQKGKVQKIEIHPALLIGQDSLDKVRSIEFDVYADALSANYKNLAGEMVQVPGTICCGGGTVTAALDSEGKGKWYNFAGFEGGEYDFDFSGPVHGTFKFLLADSGQCWDNEMEDANFLIMRWGIENESNFYVDNIVFYDADSKPIPLVKPSGNPGEEATTENGNTPETPTVTEQPVTEPSVISTETLPDGSKKITYSNGEVSVINPDGSVDLDQSVPPTEAPTNAPDNSGAIDSDGNIIM